MAIMEAEKPKRKRERVTFTVRHCLRCGYAWLPRKTGRPTLCPECKSKYWDTPRKPKNGSQEKK